MMIATLAMRLAFVAATVPAQACDKSRAETLNQEAAQATTGTSRLPIARQAVAACPALAAAQNTLGTALEETGDLGGAEKAYETAARLAPEWTIPLLGLGDTARKQQNWAAAEAFYLRAQMVARDGTELSEVTRAFSELRIAHQSASTGAEEYAAKDSRGLTFGLQLDRSRVEAPPVSRSFGAATGMTSEYVVSSQGIAANLTIGFAVNSAQLLPEGRNQLDEVGRAIAAGQPGITFVIEGHASSEGRAERNVQLSQERATAARDYLVSRFGLPSARFEIRGLGSSQPVMQGSVEDRAKTRRVALIRRYSGS